MTSRKCSGSSRPPRVVEPIKSADMTVNWRRSGSGGTGPNSAADGCALSACAVLGAPQSLQNRFRGALPRPQAWQKEHLIAFVAFISILSRRVKRLVVE
jgi:hypothetical protein